MFISIYYKRYVKCLYFLPTLPKTKFTTGPIVIDHLFGHSAPSLVMQIYWLYIELEIWIIIRTVTQCYQMGGFMVYLVATPFFSFALLLYSYCSRRMFYNKILNRKYDFSNEGFRCFICHFNANQNYWKQNEWFSKLSTGF